MAFTTNYSNIQEYQEFKEQFYEFIVKDVYEEQSKNGNHCITLELVVRNDVKQEMQNFRIWDRLYRLTATNKYDIEKLMKKGASFIGQEKSYETFEDFINDFKGRAAKGKVFLEEFNGKKKPKVGFFTKTDYPNIAHTWKEKTDSAGFSQANIQEDDLPF